jgi:hypothetical protein
VEGFFFLLEQTFQYSHDRGQTAAAAISGPRPDSNIAHKMLLPSAISRGARQKHYYSNTVFPLRT